MTDLEKLKLLLEHWKEHNASHINTYRDWSSKAEALGEKELAVILAEVARESKKLETLFNMAIGKL